MNRRISRAALMAIVLVFPVVASCQAVGRSAAGTPVASAAGKGPIIANSGPPQVNLAKCAVGAQNEPLQNFALKMTSSTTGWALGQCTLAAQPSFPNGSTINCYQAQAESMGILRTSDGGATWTDVSPPSVTNRTWHHSQFFLDANHAWVGEVSRTADACASQVTMFMTADGGRSWQQGGIIPIKTGAPTDDVFNVAGPTDGMYFTDPTHGWLMVDWWPANPQPGANFASARLYSTSDGGMHWRLIASDPGRFTGTDQQQCQSFYAPMSDAAFMSATTGWLAVSCSAPILLTTRDGGVSWTARPLPSCTCPVNMPEYFDANRALITGEQGSPVMLSTADAGTTWAQRRVPQAAMTDFSFTDPSNGWMVGIAQLPKSYETVVYRTADGGQTWSLLGKPGFATAGPNPNAYFPVVGVQFLDANTGFVVLGPEAGTQGAADPGVPDLQILSTVDGGHKWNAVLKQVPAASCSGNYTQRIGNVGGLSPAKMVSATTGWAAGGLRTTDGGAHWRDVSPSALREGSATPLYPPGYTEFYLDGDHAWQAGVYGSKTSCSDHIGIFATADGGKTWQPSAPIILSLPAGYQTGEMKIGFTSQQAGWLWVPMGPRGNDPFGFSVSSADLYESSDGGLTWNHASSLSNSQLHGIAPAAGSQDCQPNLGQLTFSSPTVGWLSLNCTDSTFLVSHDGGANWKVFNLPVPSSLGCPCNVEMPNFVDASHGVVVASGNSGLTGSTALLTTTDGGTTWRQSPRPGTGYVLQLDQLNSTDTFALVTPPGWTKVSNVGFELYRSTDGGGSWVQVNSNVPASWPPGFMQFVDLNHGFESNVNGATELLTTVDGGKSWKSITPAIGT